MWDMRSPIYHDRNKKRRVVEAIAEKLELQGKVSFFAKPATVNSCPLSELMSTTASTGTHLDTFVVSARVY